MGCLHTRLGLVWFGDVEVFEARGRLMHLYFIIRCVCVCVASTVVKSVMVRLCVHEKIGLYIIPHNPQV